MDFDDLQFMLAINKYRNISEAAASCHVSQSVMSKHIAKLEAELNGVTLCNRSKRPISITPAGKEFIQYAESICQYHHDMKLAVAKYVIHSANVLRIGSIPVMGRMGISTMLYDFRKQGNSEVEYTIIDLPSFDLLEMLESEEIDAAFIMISPTMKLDRKFTTYRLSKNKLMLAVNSSHRFARRSSVDLRELINEHIALPDQKTGMYDLTTKALADAGISSRNIQPFRNIDTVINATISGRAVTLLSERLAKSYEDLGIRLISIDKDLQITMALVIKNNHHIDPLLRELIDFVTDYKL